MAAKIADEGEVGRVRVLKARQRPGGFRQREVVVNARDQSACAGRSDTRALSGTRFSRGRRWTDRTVRSGSRTPSGRMARHAGAPQQLVADVAVDKLVDVLELVEAGVRTRMCTPVMSSSCASEKSVVMCGCVSAEPSAGGCGVAASAPSGRVRRLSFSMPRRSAARTAGDGASSRSRRVSMATVIPGERGSKVLNKWVKVDPPRAEALSAVACGSGKPDHSRRRRRAFFFLRQGRRNRAMYDCLG